MLLPPQLNTGDLLTAGPSGSEVRELGSGAVDCMRPHLPDMIELLQDPHLLNKIKVYYMSMSCYALVLKFVRDLFNN